MDSKTFDRKFERFRRASAISNKRICWTCILRFIEKNWHCKNLFGTNSGDRVVAFCLDILMEHDCIDKNFLYRLLKFYFRWHYHVCNCEDRGPEKDYARAIMKPLKIFASSHENMSISQVNLETLPVCLTDVRIMSILSKYGIYAGRSVFNIINAKKSFKKFMLSIQDNEQVWINSSNFFSQLASHILAVLVINDGKMPLSENQRGMRYIFLVVRILHALSLDLEGSPFTLNFIKCLKVFYRTIPDPFVSQNDVKEFLHFIWIILPIQLISLMRINEIYTRLFRNESPLLYAPRSLKHLCRVSLRLNLRNNMKMLPHSVRRLHIPRDLHDYLLCIEPLHM